MRLVGGKREGDASLKEKRLNPGHTAAHAYVRLAGFLLNPKREELGYKKRGWEEYGGKVGRGRGGVPIIMIQSSSSESVAEHRTKPLSH